MNTFDWLVRVYGWVVGIAGGAIFLLYFVLANLGIIQWAG